MVPDKKASLEGSMFKMKSLEAMGLEGLEKILAPTSLTFDPRVKPILLATQSPDSLNEIKQDAKNDKHVQAFVSKAEVAIGGKLIGRDQVEVNYYAYTTVSNSITEHLKENLLPEEKKELLGLQPKLDGWLFQELHNTGLPSREQIESAAVNANSQEHEPVQQEAKAARPPTRIGLDAEEGVRDAISEVFNRAKGACNAEFCIPVFNGLVSEGVISQEFLDKVAGRLLDAASNFDLSNRSSRRHFFREVRAVLDETELEAERNLQASGQLSSGQHITSLQDLDVRLVARAVLAEYFGESILPLLRHAHSRHETQEIGRKFSQISDDLLSSGTIREVLGKAEKYGIKLDADFLSSLLPIQSVLENAKSLDLSGQQAAFYGFLAYNLLNNRQKSDAQLLSQLRKDSEAYSAIFLSAAVSLLSSSGRENGQEAEKKVQEEKARTDEELAKAYGRENAFYIYASSLSAREFLDASAYAISSSLQGAIEKGAQTQLVSPGEGAVFSPPGTDESGRHGGGAALKTGESPELRVAKIPSRDLQQEFIAPESVGTSASPPPQGGAHAGAAAQNAVLEPIRFAPQKSEEIPENLAARIPEIQAYLDAQNPAEPPPLLYTQGQDGAVYAIARIKTGHAEHYFGFEISPEGRIEKASVLEPVAMAGPELATE